MGKNKDLQKMLTEFEKEFGHIKEWEIDRNNQLASIASDGGKATGPKLGRHNVESGHLQNIAKSGGLTTPLKPILQFSAIEQNFPTAVLFIKQFLDTIE